MERRKVFTGLGIVAANGIGAEHFWDSNVLGRSGINRITSFDSSPYASRVAAELKDFDPLLYMPEQVAKPVDRFVHFGLAATKLEMEDGGLEMAAEDPERAGGDHRFRPVRSSFSRIPDDEPL